MIHAYSKDFLWTARENLGFAFDYAVNHVGIDINSFDDFFIASNIASAFEKGNPKYISGLSGTELVLEVFERLNFKHTYTPYKQFSRTCEYWTGWILAFYQWYSGFSFDTLRSIVTSEEICQMYNPLHEASDEKFIEVMDSVIIRKKSSTNLQHLRKQSGLTQKQLSDYSGVNLRTLQEYETGRKNINLACGETINALAKVLCCNFYDIMELK